MSFVKRASLTWNPSWPHYVGIAATILAVLLGLLRFTFVDLYDPRHCNALLAQGSWADGSRQNWQPNGCMTHTYKPADASTCLTSRHVVFIGDSVTRKLYFQFSHILDPALPSAPADDNIKHADVVLHAKSATQLSFYWDPFLNSSRTRSYSTPFKSTSHKAGNIPRRPALLVLGSGLWYLRYAESSGGIPAWEGRMDSVLGSIAHSTPPVADQVVVLPVEEIVASKLSLDRAKSMIAADIEIMNADLFHRVHPPDLRPLPPHHRRDLSAPIALPIVFNKMLHPSQTKDGLHFSDSLIRSQANILYNLRCNEILPKRFPLDKTCCREYPATPLLQLVIIFLMIAWGPVNWINSRQPGRITIKEEQMPSLVFSAAVGLIFVADRTGLWLKEQKHYSPWTFAFLTLTALVVGLSTVKRGDKDLGFLNREQTDEWKGWMQLAILIYHYIGASKISGIYNPIRVLVAAYLFMTGYGHCHFYYSKADYSFLRVAQVMVRLNILPILLAYTMGTDYLFYYFSPLVSFWFLIIYATMVAGSRYNDRAPFLLGKLILSAAFVTWFLKEKWLLESVFDFLGIFGIHWSAREWNFRVTLDLWIVYVGMIGALVVIKMREHRMTDHYLWPSVLKFAIGGSVVILCWFLVFELLQETKFKYNAWHPYVSFLPVIAFAILRNANFILRSASSQAFAFVGRCSLETFIIQYHFWMAADTRGILLVFPGTMWRPINFILTSVMFIYISHRVAEATGYLTTWICGIKPRSSIPLPATTSTMASSPATRNRAAETTVADIPVPQSIPLVTQQHSNMKNGASSSENAPATAPSWAERLSEGPSVTTSPLSSALGNRFGEWQVGLKSKLLLALTVMWMVNLGWPIQT